jgi:hypothetical protein
MKKLLIAAMLSTLLLTLSCSAQSDKSKRPSAPAQVSETTASGLKITIDYSQPSAKGRTIGKDIAPHGKVWRTGANEATWIELSKNAMVEGKALPAGKYGLYTIPGENEWTIIFNKTWNQWGTNYTEADDALRVKVKSAKASTPTEKMTFSIAKNGIVTLMWADTKVDFTVK